MESSSGSSGDRIMPVDFEIVEQLLEELDEQLEDPEAQYELEQMEEHYHNALQAEYLEKDSDQYDF